ncbi:hypothetical protein [Marinactinospora rubrisoli]|uniref:Secreted protein/lipoprotein n=1 Tax=Marinactinospora rubrisoli TaxID=2715399 RepID=A0ABW2KBM5_9ACTN
MMASSAGRRTTAVGCAAVLLLTAGCGGSSDSATDPAATPAASPAPATEEAAVQAYTDMWDIVVAASHEGDADPDGLDRHATGDALILMRHALEGAADAEVTGEPVLNPRTELTEPDQVEITDCVDDSTWNIGGGAGGAGQRRVDAAVTHDGLVWRVSELRIWEPGTC